MLPPRSRPAHPCDIRQIKVPTLSAFSTQTPQMQGLTSSLCSQPLQSLKIEERMGSRSLSKRETHVLKLVHPGGFAELHTNPVTASDVMRRNPGHYVTRPDVFRFPWIVVSPQSILRPGNVFFIVPSHTIRHLLNKSPNTANHACLAQPPHQPSYVDHGCHMGRKISNSKKVQCFRNHSSVSSPSMSCMKLKKGGNKAQPWVRERPVCSSEYSSRDACKERALNSRGLRHCEQVPKLKPCLKKDNGSHNARSRNLKVTFACTDEGVNNATFRTEVCDP